MKLRNARLSVLAFVALLTGACVSHPEYAAGVACGTSVVSVSDDFEGARRGTCTVLGPAHFKLDIVPENSPPINDSPWFAFRLSPQQAARVRIKLRYTDGHHRYVPKISYDRIYWQPIDEQSITTSLFRRGASFELNLDERPVYVTAQELILPSDYSLWCTNLERFGTAQCSGLGYSGNRQKIFRIDVNPAERDTLLIVGRQHPPEVSGAFAFFAFADTLFAKTELAQQFREQFRIIAIPMLNPDGVIAGHWRHNPGGVDLNRDWGPFTQPETRLIHDLLQQLDDNGTKIRFFLDFHSTKRNVFYTQNEEFPTDPPGMMNDWLEQSAERIEDYAFENDARAVSEQANSKNYMYKRYGIPTATYEVGDETNRLATQKAAVVFAEELMRLLLGQDYAQ
ncbi:MAG: hypothetical protein HKN77_00200 [Woeseiaceae bacterium]|nr:hypothetical protein [Woeseiaceae bacterium]